MVNKVIEFFRAIKENWGKNKILLWALGLAGVLLFVLPGSCQPRESAAETQRAPSNYQAQLQQELESILSGIEGVGRVKVMLTLDDEQEVVYASNEETSERSSREEDSQGGIRHQEDWDRRGN
jgi:stage III sporulation protein AG